MINQNKIYLPSEPLTSGSRPSGLLTCGQVSGVDRGVLFHIAVVSVVLLSMSVWVASTQAAESGPVPRSIRVQPKAAPIEEIPFENNRRQPASEPLGPGPHSPQVAASPSPTLSSSSALSSSAPSTAPSDSGDSRDSRMVAITRVVGEVGEHIMTSREVQMADVVEQAAFGRLPGQTSIRFLTGSEKSFSADVATALREWAIFLEAKSFGSGQVSRTELSKVIREVHEVTAAHPAWQALEPSADEIAEIVERKLVAKKFLRLKMESARLPITDAEAQAYFKKNRLKFGNLPFASFRENIKTFLIKQQTDRRLEEWLDVLERRYKVRNFIAG